MKFFATVTLLASAASAAVLDVTKRDVPLAVTLEKTGNTQVKATVVNNGKEAVKVFKTGTFLDDAAVEKVDVFQGYLLTYNSPNKAEKVAFDGLRLRVATSGLPEDAFRVIAPGASVEATFDIAHLHDLSQGGAYDVVSTSGFLTAALDSTTLDGVVPYTSNTLKAVEVDGAQAAEARASFIGRRTSLQSDCTGSKSTAIRSALSNCASAARNAASTARSSSSKMTEYFKSSSSSTVSTVANVFTKVASECGSTSGGSSRLYCSDVYGACSSGVLAYTLPSSSYMAYCNLFFSALSGVSRTCHDQDQASTVLHEATHLTQIKGTSDYNGYGYSYVRSLSASQNLNHADTYALFAQSIYAGC
ncbi:deuterolysin metalloprotease protein [Apiospora hydei]|uniref:Neutral protease 2 n=1 Tax=Apiospora hydei TaxID=1337664 RepID=A0ABR1XDP3_9PEZI